jgi:hypothetical protein
LPADLQDIFRRLRRVLERHSPPFVERSGTVKGKDDYHLWSERDVEVAGRPRKEVYFAGLIVQKGYVGFYYMPVYTAPERKELFEPELLQLLKGKSCFHVRKLDDDLLGQIDDAVQAGHDLYRERGWV